MVGRRLRVADTGYRIVSASKAETVEEVFNEYLNQVKTGTQVDLSKTRYDDPRFALQVNLQNDAARFATFREAQKQRELAAVSTDLDKARIERKYAEFLKTETQTIFANSAAAERWMGFAENADIYPNLEYRTAGDDDVREEHARLNGIILPYTDPFWSGHTPPLGWGCRCELVQTDAPANKSEEKYKGFEKTPMPKGFDFNPGVEQKLFSENAGYYTSVTKDYAKKLTAKAMNFSEDVFEKEMIAAATKMKVKASGMTIAFDESGVKQTREVNSAKNKALAMATIYDIKNLLKGAKVKSVAPEVGETGFVKSHIWRKKGYMVQARELLNGKILFDFLKLL